MSETPAVATSGSAPAVRDLSEEELAAARMQDFHWRRGPHLITTSRALLQPAFLNDIFASDEMDWTFRRDESTLRVMLDHSVNLGVYLLPPSPAAQAAILDALTRPPPSPTGPAPAPALAPLEQIGFARLVTDRVTHAWLNDVYVVPAHRHQGLHNWLNDCTLEMTRIWRVGVLRAIADRSTLERYGRIGLKERPMKNPDTRMLVVGPEGILEELDTGRIV